MHHVVRRRVLFSWNSTSYIRKRLSWESESLRMSKCTCKTFESRFSYYKSNVAIKLSANWYKIHTVSGRNISNLIIFQVWKDAFLKKKNYAPSSNKVWNSYFYSIKVNGKVNDVGVIWIGIFSGVCMSNMKYLSLTLQSYS